MWWPRKLCAILVLGWLSNPGLQAELRPGDPMPSLESMELAGSEIPATSGRVVLLDFWASWCAPCRASFPAFAELHREYAARGLLILAVGVDEKPAAHAGFLKKMNPPFVTLHDRNQRLVAAVSVPAMPTSLLFGRDGRLRAIHEGFHGRTTVDALR
ncbi:MAG: TlpA disulfide reductase family protein, partial [Opitutus sp.]